MTLVNWLGIGLVAIVGALWILTVIGYMRGRIDRTQLVDAMIISPATMLGCVGVALTPSAWTDYLTVTSVALIAIYLAWRHLMRKAVAR